MRPSGNSHHKTVAPGMNLCRANQNQYSHALSQQKMAAMCYLKKKSLFLKQHVVNTDKTRSKHTRSQFPFHTLLTMTPRIVTMSN